MKIILISGKARHGKDSFATFMKEDLERHNKKVLIVDDVCTTGSTIKAMIKLLNSKKPKQIKVLVLSHTKEKN